MAFQRMQTELTNWSKTACSACTLYRVSDMAGIASALEEARAQHFSVILRGAGHSYTDAALNTGGVVIDITPMRRILAWDAGQGIMRVEPGVTLRDMIDMAWKDGWWPAISPSTPEVTISGCAAMNVNGRNSWKYGPFGEWILALEVLLVTGEVRTLERERDAQLFHAFIGSMGLLGLIVSLTVQLQRISSGLVIARRRSAASLDETFSIIEAEEQGSDFIEAWLDGFAGGDQLGRGQVTSAKLGDSEEWAPSAYRTPGLLERMEVPLARMTASLARPVLQPGVRMANRANYWWKRWRHQTAGRLRALYPFSFWPPAAFAGYQAMFPEGVETFQAFVPGQQAREIFRRVLRYSQQQGFPPIWCIIKKHRCDDFLLSYQVDGFSLELSYSRTHRTAQPLQQVLQAMIPTAIEAGGRFYLAKDHFLTPAQYRQSVGDETFEAFLGFKERFDPEMLLQSDLFRRVFRPSQQ